MKKWFSLEGFCLRNDISTRLQYRLDFALSSIGLGLAQIAIPIFMVLIYNTSPGFPGWSAAEALLLTGYIALAEAISVTFVQKSIDETSTRVREGTMDLWILAPTNTLGYIINRSIDVEGIGRLIFSSAVVVYAGYLLELSITTILLLAAYLIIPVLLFSSLYIIACAASLVHVRTERVYEILHFITVFGKYPSSIYPQTLRFATLTLIPVAAMGSAPIQVFLKSQTPLLLVSALCVLLITAASIKYFNYSLQHYTSANG